MGVPTSEVVYTSATNGRGDHEVHKGHVVALVKNCLIIVSDFAKSATFVFRVEEAGFEVSSSWCLPKPMQSLYSRRRSDSWTTNIGDLFVIFFRGATVHRGPRSPSYRSFMITCNDVPHSVGLLWAKDQPDADTCTWQHTKLTRDWHPCHSKIAATDPSLEVGTHLKRYRVP
jgi:hypothetical protein